LKNKTQRDTKLKFYKVMATPVLLYGCERLITKQDKSRRQAAEMKFLCEVMGCTCLDKFQNEDIRRDQQILSLNYRILEYKHQWFQQVQQMENDRLPKRSIVYKPDGRRCQGHTMKRWADF
jgi:hypothetical protein